MTLIYNLINRIIEEDSHDLFQNNSSNPIGSFTKFINFNKPPALILNDIRYYFHTIINNCSPDSLLHSESCRMLRVVDDYLSLYANPMNDQKAADSLQQVNQFASNLYKQNPNQVSESLLSQSTMNNEVNDNVSTSKKFDFSSTAPKHPGEFFELFTLANSSVFSYELPDYMSLYLESIKHFSKNIKVDALHEHIKYLETDDTTKDF